MIKELNSLIGLVLFGGREMIPYSTTYIYAQSWMTSQNRN